jgi:hypothetical protein
LPVVPLPATAAKYARCRYQWLLPEQGVCEI